MLAVTTAHYTDQEIDESGSAGCHFYFPPCFMPCMCSSYPSLSVVAYRETHKSCRDILYISINNRLSIYLLLFSLWHIHVLNCAGEHHIMLDCTCTIAYHFLFLFRFIHCESNGEQEFHGNTKYLTCSAS